MDAQNQKEQIERLAAQRQLYSEEKTLMKWQFSLALGASILIAIFESVMPQLKDQILAISIVITLLDLFVLEQVKGQKKKAAAKIQELFDCDVLQIARNNVLLQESPAPEEIIETAKRHPCDRWKALQTWYIGDLNKVALDIARVICQRTNCYYDQRLRERWVQLLIISLIVLVVACAVVGIVGGVSVADALVRMVAPLLPFATFAALQIKDNREAIERLNQIRKQAERTWGLAIEPTLRHADLLSESRTLQDLIFQHRASSPTLLDLFYVHMRTEREAIATESANRLIEQALAITQSNP